MGDVFANISSIPYLGVCLSETLEWEAHINKITSKANSTLGFLRRNLKACPPKLRGAAYFSLVRSSLEFSSAVWDPFRQKYIDKLENIQRSADRFVTQNYRQTVSVTSLIQNLVWTDLKIRREICNCKHVRNFKWASRNSYQWPLIDRRTRGGHNQAYKHLRANTTLGQNLALNYPWLEYSSGSCQSLKNCGSVQESAGWLSPPASSPLQPDTPHRRCCWSSKFKDLKNSSSTCCNNYGNKGESWHHFS